MSRNSVCISVFVVDLTSVLLFLTHFYYINFFFVSGANAYCDLFCRFCWCANRLVLAAHSISFFPCILYPCVGPCKWSFSNSNCSCHLFIYAKAMYSISGIKSKSVGMEADAISDTEQFISTLFTVAHSKMLHMIKLITKIRFCLNTNHSHNL